MNPQMTSSSSSSAFSMICILHSMIAITSGSLMMFQMKEIYTFTHGNETATKLMGSTPHDQLLIRTSDSFSGLLLFDIGFLIFMVSFVKDREFQSFFAKGCTVLHVFMVIWRVNFERRVEVLAFRLLETDSWRYLISSLLGFFSCFFLEREVRLGLYCFHNLRFSLPFPFSFLIECDFPLMKCIVEIFCRV
ncbi:PROTEIN putative-RELATED [Salix koriyanagi]|uniref:PROTEIN putative-RELATED n=1 Tax=Salix koriyanagi TaxID=2511006 RepID=A0A9Q0UEQ2_9ROSI|nr:PROTEIN putative-RELATED [Salix koriyanagi]